MKHNIQYPPFSKFTKTFIVSVRVYLNSQITDHGIYNKMFLLLTTLIQGAEDISLPDLICNVASNWM